MINPHLYNFYSYAVNLHPLGEIAPDTKFRDNPDLIKVFTGVQHLAGWFSKNSFCKTYLPSSAAKIGQIATFVSQGFLMSSSEHPMPDTVSEWEATNLREQVQEFETLLEDEVNRLPIFCLEDEKIGNFSVSKLLKGASNGVAERTKAHLTKRCIEEVDEAGKCLVFERSTAAGFHMLRSVELSIIQYLQAIPGFTMPPLNRQSWGEYLTLLKDHGAAREVTDHLYNIKDNYRNPLMHPQDSLELDDAVSLFGVVQSMNEMLIADMKKRGLIKCQTNSGNSTLP